MDYQGIPIDLIALEKTLPILARPWGKVARDHSLPQYDFDFRTYFECSSLYRFEPGQRAIHRMGSILNYTELEATCAERGIELLTSARDYHLCSELTGWYPLITDLTPRSVVFDKFPSLTDVTSQFQWPVFMKGERQTSAHKRELAIIESAEQFKKAEVAYVQDPILNWQKIVVREFLPLRSAGESTNLVIPTSFEFRSFWWKGELAGIGPYWLKQLQTTLEELTAATAIAQEAARRIGAPFIVIDVAQTQTGRWIVIECNDAQESGYAGVKPMLLWRKILDLERQFS